MLSQYQECYRERHLSFYFLQDNVILFLKFINVPQDVDHIVSQGLPLMAFDEYLVPDLVWDLGCKELTL